jgi:hypothetical protein
VSRLTWGIRQPRLPFRLRDSHPVPSAFPCRFDYRSLVPSAAPLPRLNFLSRFGLFPFRSPLLRESLLFSFPPGTEMFHFPGFAPARLCIHRAVRRHYAPRVSPFGHLRVIAWLAALRSFSQPPTSFIASDCLGIHRVPFVAWSLPPLFVLAAEASEAISFFSSFFSSLSSCQRTQDPLYASEVNLSRQWWSRSGSNR